MFLYPSGYSDFLFYYLLIFLKGFVFEWLDWNGTRKNDWFFALWWGFNFLWPGPISRSGLL